MLIYALELLLKFASAYAASVSWESYNKFVWNQNMSFLWKISGLIKVIKDNLLKKTNEYRQSVNII